MKHCCIYVFDQPRMLRNFPFFDIGSGKDYFEPVHKTSFINSPLGKSLLENSNIKANCYFSGTYLNALAGKEDEIQTLQSLHQKGQIELLSGTHYTSLSCLFSSYFFSYEIDQHQKVLKELFDVAPDGFINTLAIFTNDLSVPVAKKGFKYIVVPRIEWFLGDKADLRVFKSKNKKIDLLLVGKSESDKGIIVSYLDGSTSRHWDLDTITASQAILEIPASTEYNLPNPVALDPDERDLTAYFGNALQKQIFKKISELSPKIEQYNDPSTSEDFLMLASSSVFERLQQVLDGRYDTYTKVMNCLTDLELRIN